MYVSFKQHIALSLFIIGGKLKAPLQYNTTAEIRCNVSGFILRNLNFTFEIFYIIQRNKRAQECYQPRDYKLQSTLNSYWVVFLQSLETLRKLYGASKLQANAAVVVKWCNYIV